MSNYSCTGKCRAHAIDPTCPKHGVTANQFYELSQRKTIATLVKEDLDVREAYGTEQYGVPLLEDSSKHDALQEAYEEALDLVVYLRLELERRG